MSIAERLKELVNQEGSQAEFCRKTGISTGALSNILMRNSGISSSNLEQIAKTYPNLNLRWLLTGEELMWVDQERSTATSSTAPELSYEQMAALLVNRVRELERELKQIDPDAARRLGIK